MKTTLFVTAVAIAMAVVACEKQAGPGAPKAAEHEPDVAAPPPPTIEARPRVPVPPSQVEPQAPVIVPPPRVEPQGPIVLPPPIIEPKGSPEPPPPAEPGKKTVGT